MENATKALLIAAAVLIVILVIALGMRIFNSTSDVSGQAQDIGHQISTQTGQATEILQSQLGVGSTSQGTGGAQSEADNFNLQFNKYIGENINRGNAQECIRKIVESNNINTNHPITGTIVLNNGNISINGNAANIETIITYRVVGNKYKIVSGKDSDGYINKITIIYMS